MWARRKSRRASLAATKWQTKRRILLSPAVATMTLHRWWLPNPHRQRFAQVRCKIFCLYSISRLIKIFPVVSSNYLPKPQEPEAFGFGQLRCWVKNYIQSLRWQELLLFASTILLLLLFLSAACLLYRIHAIQAQFNSNSVISSRWAADSFFYTKPTFLFTALFFICSDDVYKEIMKWQIHLHSKSSNEVQQFLNSNLNQIAKVR